MAYRIDAIPWGHSLLQAFQCDYS